MNFSRLKTMTQTEIITQLTSRLSRVERRLRTLETSTPLLRAEEAADLLRVSKAVLTRLTKSGEIAHVKMGGLTLYKRADIADYIESRRTRSNDEVNALAAAYCILHNNPNN